MVHRIDAQQRIKRVVFEGQRLGRIRHHEFQKSSDATAGGSRTPSAPIVELNPANGRALSLGAGALYEDGQTERALEWARGAESLYPDDMGVTINGALLRAVPRFIAMMAKLK